MGRKSVVLLCVGAAVMAGAAMLNARSSDSLPTELAGYFVFFIGGVATALAICLLTGVTEKWTTPASLALTLLGVLLLAAAQFDDERKTTASFSAISLQGALDAAQSRRDQLLSAYGGDPATFEKSYFIAMQKVVATAYQAMQRYCVTELALLVQEVQSQKHLEIDITGKEVDPISETLTATSEAMSRKGLGCGGIDKIAGWFAAETLGIADSKLDRIRKGQADDLELAALFSQAPLVFRHLYALDAYKESFSVQIPAFSQFRPPRDDLADWLDVNARLPGLTSSAADAKLRADAMTQSSESYPVLLARTINLSIWTFALVLAVSIDAAVWLFGLQRVKASFA